MPFATTAVLSASGASLNVADFYFASLALCYFVFHFDGKIRRLFLVPIALAVYAIITALFYPTIFRGMFVIPVSLSDGVRLSTLFSTSLVPLEHSSANISQTFYLIISVVYIMFFATIARKSPHKIHKMLVIAGVTNIILSCLALALGPFFLDPLLTGDNKVKLGASASGFARLVGSFPEASRYADFSAAMGAYFLGYYYQTGKRWFLASGMITLIFCLLSVSSTGFVAIAAFGLFTILKGTSGRKVNKKIYASVGLVVTGALLFLAAKPDLVLGVLEAALFSKADSVSGYERGAWAYYGIKAFWDSYGLGVGAGSVRSNGLLLVLLSNIGLIGTLLFATILIRALRNYSTTPYQAALNYGIVAILAARMVSIDVLTCGVLFCALIGAKYPLEAKQFRHKKSYNPGPFRMSAESTHGELKTS